MVENTAKETIEITVAEELNEINIKAVELMAGHIGGVVKLLMDSPLTDDQNIRLQRIMTKHHRAIKDALAENYREVHAEIRPGEEATEDTEGH